MLVTSSQFSWPVAVPSALRAPAPVNLGVRPMLNSPLAQAKRATSSVATGSQARSSWFAQALVACLHSSWHQPSS